jgi:hypothetical protein
MWSQRIERRTSQPWRARMDSWRCSGRWSQNFETMTWASRPASTLLFGIGSRGRSALVICGACVKAKQPPGEPFVSTAITAVLANRAAFAAGRLLLGVGAVAVILTAIPLVSLALYRNHGRLHGGAPVNRPVPELD